MHTTTKWYNTWYDMTDDEEKLHELFIKRWHLQLALQGGRTEYFWGDTEVQEEFPSDDTYQGKPAFELSAEEDDSLDVFLSEHNTLGTILSTLPEQFPEDTTEAESTLSTNGDTKPQSKLGAAKLLLKDALSEFSSGVYMSVYEHAQVIQVFCSSLSTEWPMNPVDAVSEVHPEHGYMLTRRNTPSQVPVIRKAIKMSSQCNVIQELTEMYGAVTVHGVASGSISKTLNTLAALYKVVREVKQLREQVSTTKRAVYDGKAERDKHVQALHTSGTKLTDIAVQTGVSLATVKRILKSSK